MSKFSYRRYSLDCLYVVLRCLYVADDRVKPELVQHTNSQVNIEGKKIYSNSYYVFIIQSLVL